MKPPYSIDMADKNHFFFLDLLTGDVLSKGSSDKPSIAAWLKDMYGGCFGLFLVLNGKDMSNVVVGNIEINKFIDRKPFYLDRFGDTDVGFKYHSYLTLDQEKYFTVFDDFLACNWANYE